MVSVIADSPYQCPVVVVNDPDKLEYIPSLVPVLSKITVVAPLSVVLGDVPRSISEITGELPEHNIPPCCLTANREEDEITAPSSA